MDSVQRRLLPFIIAGLIAVQFAGSFPAGAQVPQPAPPPPEEAIAGSESPNSTKTDPPQPTDPSAASLSGGSSIEIEALKSQIRQLLQRVEQLEQSKKNGEPPDQPATQPESTGPQVPSEAAGADSSTSSTGGAGKALLLPDISLIGTFVSHVGSDNRDLDRNRIFLESAELGIQGYVYPSVKADAFIVMSSETDHTAQVEEAYLTALNLGKGLSARVGKTKVPFGRTNLLHPHSWLYTTPPLAIKNLVAPESLAGQGAFLSYLIPTRGKLFAQFDVGLWNSPEAPEFGDPGDTSAIFRGSGAAFNDRFGTYRLWAAHPVGENGEFELGASYASGHGVQPPPGTTLQPKVHLTGVDTSYRLIQGSGKRLLLRSEYFSHNTNLPGEPMAKGYYVLADQKLSPYRAVGLRYDWSEYPYAAGLHESGASAIFTNRLTEQTYLRLQLTHGARPGDSSYNEAWLQWVWGVGPHSHALE